ncbi:MAG: hypothetical protein R3185_08415, partial [Candidatus Thermoplasmatota archaeon]|nr:hypothetical protein [Candidatus Thermoplasmatota archaeon]
LTGTVGCEATLLERAWQAFSGRTTCDYDGYAYAYPAGATAPWNATIEWVNDSYYADEAGSIWHVAEVVYRDLDRAPEGHGTLVKAMASEILPDQLDQGGRSANYALPVDPAHLDHGENELIVGIGPTPPVTPA